MPLRFQGSSFRSSMISETLVDVTIRFLVHSLLIVFAYF